MSPKSNDTIDMFYGFWKYLGLSATFLVGVTLTWWGTNIILHEYEAAIEAIGLIGIILVMPLVIGLILSWVSFAEFLRIIRE